MSINLRTYQQDCLQNILDYKSQGINRQLVQLPTGAGKTVVFAHLIQEMKCRTLVLAHTLELIDQAKDKIKMICPDLDVGIVQCGIKEIDRPVVVSSIQSARQPETLEILRAQNFSLLIYDECHHAASDSARMVIKELGFGSGTQKLFVGFSATPARSDTRGLGNDFDQIVFTKPIRDLIAEEYLCQPKGVKIATDLDLDRVSTLDGDFVAKSLAKVMDTDQMNDLVVKTFLEQASDRKTICFAVSIDHAQHLNEKFLSAGFSSKMVCGATPKDERDGILTQFKQGQVSVLTNCQVLTEGFDCPDVSCIILARPTKSASLYQQMAGRGLRRHPNKNDCLILDFGDVSHSLCGVFDLTSDAELVSKRHHDDIILKSFAKSLPPTINQKLKKAIIEFDLFGENFTWIKDGPSYSLKGASDYILKIFPTAEGLFSVILFSGNGSKAIASDLTFEYAFASAEEFAKQNRSLFSVSDLEAPWRTLPISDKQKDIFRSSGYRAGIDELSRGQASLIIGSGVLKRKAARG